MSHMSFTIFVKLTGLRAKHTMEVLREFLESSTIHGLTYISTAKVRNIVYPYTTDNCTILDKSW